VSGEVYEQRLVLFADVLGWRASASDAEKLLAVAAELHAPAEAHNEATRNLLRAGGPVQTEYGPLGINANPLFLETQFAVFSDNFAWSMPAGTGARILGVASKLTISLLRKGFLVRGGVTLGPLYHKDNVVFGPALNEAVRLEHEEAIYPRILISADAAAHMQERPNGAPFGSVNPMGGVAPDARDHRMIRDHMGCLVVNPLAIGFDAPQDLITRFVAGNIGPSEIDRVIVQRIEELEARSLTKQAEKWLYMQRLIAGPVLDDSPKLRKAWQELAR
jgi:hypothetical protein